MVKYLFTLYFVGTCFYIFGQNPVMISRTDAISDIEFMINSIENVHYDSYFKVSKEKFEIKKDSIIETWPKNEEIPLKQFLLTTLKLSAYLSSGHTSVDWQNQKLFPEFTAYGFLPFKMKLDIDNKLKVSFSMDDEVVVGSEIKTINGKKATDIFKDIMECSGGNPNFKNEFAEGFLPLYLFLNGINAPYLIEINNGDIAYIPNGLNIIDASILLTSNLPEKSYSFDILNANLGYIAFNSNVYLDSFQMFLDQTFDSLNALNILDLIIDIRNNNGANPEFNDLLIPYISRTKYKQSSARYWKVSDPLKDRIIDSAYADVFGQKFVNKYLNAKDQSIIKVNNKKKIKPIKRDNYFDGRIIFLIGPNTYASGNALADAVKTYNLGTLIGQPTGENSNSYGELIQMEMPKSETYFFITTTFDIGADGNINRNSPISPDIVSEGDALIFAQKWLTKN